MLSPDIGRASPTKETIATLLNSLDYEDYQAAASFIGYLIAMRKKSRAEESRKILSDIQKTFKDDKGWESEADMIEDMAQFRRERMGI